MLRSAIAAALLTLAGPALSQPVTPLLEVQREDGAELPAVIRLEAERPTIGPGTADARVAER